MMEPLWTARVAAAATGGRTAGDWRATGVSIDSRTLARGAITPEEGDELKEVRSRLGLTDHQAAEIVRLLARRQSAARCPHCGGALGPVATAPPEPADADPGRP